MANMHEHWNGGWPPPGGTSTSKRWGHPKTILCCFVHDNKLVLWPSFSKNCRRIAYTNYYFIQNSVFLLGISLFWSPSGVPRVSGAQGSKTWWYPCPKQWWLFSHKKVKMFSSCVSRPSLRGALPFACVWCPPLSILPILEPPPLAPRAAALPIYATVVTATFNHNPSRSIDCWADCMFTNS